jgi:hypothetical protein
MSYERTDEDLVIVSGRHMPTPAEIARRSLAAQLRTEDLLIELLAALRAPDLSGAPLPPESAPTGETTAPKSRRKPS